MMACLLDLILICSVVATCRASRCHTRIGVILPFDTDHVWSVPKVKGAIEIAIESIESRHNDLLPGCHIEVTYGDSKCSETFGPLAAIDMFYLDKADVFIGPVCDYALAPVARFSPHWNIPVLTPGGMVRAFSHKAEFSLLTRIGGTYSVLGNTISALLDVFDWSRAGLIYSENQGRRSGQGKTTCWFVMEGLYWPLRQKLNINHPGEDLWYKAFDEHAEPDENLANISTSLEEAKEHVRVIVLCASPKSIREIMITAADLNMDNGEYVFINMDLFSSMDQLGRPWYDQHDTEARNYKAQRAFEALMTVTLRRPDSEAYMAFSAEVKRRAHQDYGDTIYSEEEVGSFVGVFHDAILLYAHALNETLEAGFNVTNGLEITRRMWNRSIEGITGEVSVDSNGDRNVDYSLLDLNPETGKFEVVASYYGHHGQYEPVQGKQIHWAGGHDGPPPDTPEGGFGTTDCPPQESFPTYGIILIVIGSLLLISLLLAICAHRYHRRKRELAEVNLQGKWDNMFNVSEKPEHVTGEIIDRE